MCHQAYKLTTSIIEVTESIAFLLTSMKILHTTMFFEPAILKDQYYKWNKNRVFLLTQGIHIYH